jgi:hypothetical protein
MAAGSGWAATAGASETAAAGTAKAGEPAAREAKTNAKRTALLIAFTALGYLRMLAGSGTPSNEIRAVRHADSA